MNMKWVELSKKVMKCNEKENQNLLTYFLILCACKHLLWLKLHLVLTLFWSLVSAKWTKVHLHGFKNACFVWAAAPETIRIIHFTVTERDGKPANGHFLVVKLLAFLLFYIINQKFNTQKLTRSKELENLHSNFDFFTNEESRSYLKSHVTSSIIQ